MENIMKLDIDTVAYMLYLNTWLNENENIYDLDLELLTALKIKWDTIWLPALNQPHYGDCTKQSISCVRCCIENFYIEAKTLVEVS